jgi:elongation factor P hydroxylase
MTAIEEDYKEIVNMILEKGVDVNAQDQVSYQIIVFFYILYSSHLLHCAEGTKYSS